MTKPWPLWLATKWQQAIPCVCGHTHQVQNVHWFHKFLDAEWRQAISGINADLHLNTLNAIVGEVIWLHMSRLWYIINYGLSVKCPLGLYSVASSNFWKKYVRIFFQFARRFIKVSDSFWFSKIWWLLESW